MLTVAELQEILANECFRDDEPIVVVWEGRRLQIYEASRQYGKLVLEIEEVSHA